MTKKLVIVESPAKAKTIAGILGQEYLVKSSVGHVRDLPKHSLGVNIEDDFTPNYEITKDKTKVIRELRQAVRDSSRVYLAPDPDREGEAIAWHLQELLAGKADLSRFARVQFNEITPRAVRQSFEHPGTINMDRVNAQQARRLLDRIVGYKVSPLLWRQVGRGLSAGRVQSVALGLICEREQEIANFKPEEYWLMGAKARKLIVPLDPFNLRLSRLDGKRASIHEKSLAQEVLRELDQCSMRVTGVKKRSVSRRPQPPFITSSMQQAASNEFGYSPGRTMRLAQNLYEGYDFGDGAVGLITYMRTDSVSVSRDAMTAVRDYIAGAFGPEYMPEKPNLYRSRASAQEAHEAIRPTDPGLTPEMLADKLDPPTLKLYKLIWKRFVASQMTPAKIDYRIVEVEPAPDNARRHTYLFTATAAELAFPGFMRVAGSSTLQAEKKDDGEDPVQTLPPLGEKEPLECIELVCQRKETKPPPRYSEASLIRALEANGVGRPSTYAGIIETLAARKYMAREKRSLKPTELGDRVSRLLRAKLAELFDVGFTAGMEADLDRIEAGDVDWKDMLREFYARFEQMMESARVPPADREQVDKVLSLLGQVKDWAPPMKMGSKVFSDKIFVDSVASQAEGERPISPAQLEALLRVMCRYKEQIEGATDTLRAMEREDLLDDPSLRPPDETTLQKLSWLGQFDLDEEDRRFLDSFKAQVGAGRKLSEAQTRVLDSLVVVQARKNRVESPERVFASFGINPPDESEAEQVRSLLDALQQVKEWRKATRKGKRVFDDQAFYVSLGEQFKKRLSLSPRQVSALRRLVARYREQIPQYGNLAAKYGIEERQRRASSTAGKKGGKGNKTTEPGKDSPA